ncbi:hypothetical protein E2C01_027234 [Portunus trituberculatus]|uniref:C2H2-type domain-containing protein n=1 Tax=Portunus trituberculatus TaxID=210409 RepID=A0A5B7EKK6_PORTR|nr:hypothetical protein [Portunus trituberculatus]
MASQHTGSHDFTYEQYEKLYTQKKYMDEDSLNEADLNKFECDECGKFFSRKQDLPRHSLTHTDGAAELSSFFVANNTPLDSCAWQCAIIDANSPRCSSKLEQPEPVQQLNEHLWLAENKCCQSVHQTLPGWEVTNKARKLLMCIILDSYSCWQPGHYHFQEQNKI